MSGNQQNLTLFSNSKGNVLKVFLGPPGIDPIQEDGNTRHEKCEE